MLSNRPAKNSTQPNESLKTNSKQTNSQWHISQHFWMVQEEIESEGMLITVREMREWDTY